MAAKCDWDGCDDPVYDVCGFCNRPLCEYHLLTSETHDALDQTIIDDLDPFRFGLDDDDEDLD